jgi:hypothetical protein
MDDDVSRILGLAASTNTQVLYGVFVQLNTDGTMTVDVQGNRLTSVNVASAWRPVANDKVAVLLVGQIAYMVGPGWSPPPIGTVKSVTSSAVTLSTDQGDVVATYTQGQTLNVGVVVKLYWSGGAHVVGVIATPAVPVPPPPPATGGATAHQDKFTVLDAGTWNASSGWWQAQVWSSDTTIGAWFYGSKIADTIRGGKVSRVQIYLPIASGYGNRPTLGTHPYGGKPGGTPTVSDAVAVPVGGSGWYDLPVAFGQYLASNVGGIGTNHGGFWKFASRAADAQTGALLIDSVY